MSTSGIPMVAWIAATRAGSLVWRLTLLCDTGSLVFASTSRWTRKKAAPLFLLLLCGWTQQAGLGQTPNKDLARAEILVGQGKLDEAVALLEFVRRNQPELAGVEAKLGKAYYKK